MVNYSLFFYQKYVYLGGNTFMHTLVPGAVARSVACLLQTYSFIMWKMFPYLIQEAQETSYWRKNGNYISVFCLQ